MTASEREGNYRNRLNMASGFMFSSSVYPHIQLYLNFFSLKSVLFYFSLLPSHSSHPALIYTNSFSLASFSSVPYSNLCQMLLPSPFSFPAVQTVSPTLLWLLFTFQPFPQLHLLTILPHPSYKRPVHTHPHSSSGPVINSSIFNRQTQALLTSCQHPTSSSPTDLPTRVQNTAPSPAAKKPSITTSFMKLASSNNCIPCAAFLQSIQKSIACTVLFPVPITSRALYCLFWKNMISLLSDDFCSL